MFTQPLPLASHCCHWKAIDVGLLVQVPGDAASASPFLAVPVIVGKAVFAGGAVGGGGGTDVAAANGGAGSMNAGTPGFDPATVPGLQWNWTFSVPPETERWATAMIPPPATPVIVGSVCSRKESVPRAAAVQVSGAEVTVAEPSVADSSPLPGVPS